MLRRPAWLPGQRVLQESVAKALPYPYYRLQLVEYTCGLLPEAGPCIVLDVGAGDGEMARLIQHYRPDTTAIAVETFLRSGRNKDAQFVRFDGIRLPFEDATFDVSLLLNVLHHAQAPELLLREIYRVTRSRVIVKDHLAHGWVDRMKLGLLDILGNAGTGAVVSARYLSRTEWLGLLSGLPSAEVTWHEDLSFRKGWLERLFSNRLEMMLQIDRGHT
jgi:SAM-dependent methyltransferase